ncbi:MAG: HEAT repeat domain-containing protein [Caloramator sp.]|nr:HEAT repeat domain-containing protein [Caloramator sp.]
MKNLSWENIDLLSDADISYLLYKEGKGINTISKIRGIEKNTVERQIIECRIKYRTHELGDNPEKIINSLFKCNRKERVILLEELDDKKKKALENYAIDNLFSVNRDECLFLIWLLGELKSKRAIQPIMAFLKCTDGNIKRICCSSLAKIEAQEAEDALIFVLNDKRPQVKQYAIKALGRIKSKKAIKYLQGILKDKNEKEYIIRAAEIALKEIEGSKYDV